jgi:phosphatidylinositol alpha-mannosyltransferase
VPDRRLRICTVVPYDLAEEGGVKKNAVYVAEELRRLGDEVVVVGPSSARELPPGQVGFGGVVNIPANGSDNRMALFVPPWRVARFLRRGRFDVLHLHEPQVPTLGYWAGWFGPRLPTVVTFHGVREHEGRLMRWARQVTGALLLSRFQRGIAVSPVAADYARVVWRGPMSIVPNGVPTDVFHPPDGDAPRAAGPVRLLFVSHWRDARKGLPVLLEAFRRVRARGADVRLDVVGEGSSAPPALEGVTFHGAISDVARLAAMYRACDVFVAPATHGESFGIVLLEAMASGRAVLCSDIPGYRAVIGDAGRLAAAGQADAFADAIAALAADPEQRRRLGAASRRRAESFGWRQIALDVRAEYLAALGRVPSARPVAVREREEPRKAVRS